MTKAQKTKQETVTLGICYMCNARCPIMVHVVDGKAVKIDMVNPKVVCPRWKAQLDFVYHPERLKYPLKRTGPRGSHAFQRISWDEALDTVASKLSSIRDKYGPESVVFYISYTKEPRPYFHRLAHAFGSPNYCTESSNCFTATRLAAMLTYGADYDMLAAQSAIADPVSKCKMVWGSSIEASSPPMWKDNVEAVKNRTKLIVVDPRRTTLAGMADIHLQIRPGTDGALALGMMKVIINQGLYDKDFVEKWTVGFDELKELVKEYPLEKVEKITWVPAEKIMQAAIMYATTKPAKVGLSGQSVMHCPNGVQNYRAVIILAALTGNFEIPGGNRFPLGDVPKNDVTLHDRIATMPPGLGTKKYPLWTGFMKETQANCIVSQFESSKPYPIKAIFGAGLNISYFANSNHFTEMLTKLDFTVITEYFHTQTTAYADIILPIASWLERPILLSYPGAYVNLLQPAIEPVGECRTEFQIFSDLAKRWGFGEVFWNGDFEKSVDDILQPSGLKIEELKKHPQGMSRIIPPREAKHYEKAGFTTPSGKVEIASSLLKKNGFNPLPAYKEPPESPLSQPEIARSFPLVLTTGGRQMMYVHSQFRNIPRLRKMMPEPLLDINPADAKTRKIQTGDKVVISSPRGKITMTANVSDTILAGVVHAPHMWPGDQNVNILIDDQTLDPLSGFGPFKAQLCQVVKV